MKIPVMIPNHEYDIILERGALAHLADYVKIQGKVLLITDTGVPQAHIELVSAQLADCDCYIVEQGEGSKSFTVLQKILSYMLAHDFQRSDCVIALGGGVVGDLAGLPQVFTCAGSVLSIFRRRLWHRSTAASAERPQSI